MDAAMAELKVGEPFGLDPALVKSLDWNLALERIKNDLRSDFIYAPHFGFMFSRAGDYLVEELSRKLSSGKYSPGAPITMEVPKSNRMKIINNRRRLGPSFSRPGSILLPEDRVFYQKLADEAAAIVEARLDRRRSYSHQVADPKSEQMFAASRTCWNQLQKALGDHSRSRKMKYVVRLDVAHYFGSINQHTLINLLKDSGYTSALASRLEILLTSLTGDRNSRGILQGLFPSDLLGNFYLCGIDTVLEESGLPSARYVDDIYVFVPSVGAAEQALLNLIPALRSYDIVLNESKCAIMPKSALITEEPDLEALFEKAIEEISSQMDDEDFDADYGFQSEWDDEDEEDENLELEATKSLFDSISDFPGQEEKIERFCLPLFFKSGSDYAIKQVLESFTKRPSMAQIYSVYLSKFLDHSEVYKFLDQQLLSEQAPDWQQMWVLAALLQKKTNNQDTVKRAFGLLKDTTRHDALRAVAAIYVGRYGDHTRRKALFTMHTSASEYVRSAIYYSSRYWSGVEKTNARASWGNQNSLNSILSVALAKK